MIPQQNITIFLKYQELSLVFTGFKATVYNLAPGALVFIKKKFSLSKISGDYAEI